MTTLCIEGWRGVNHSIAMVNQHQMLAMLDTPGLTLRHRDLPFFLPHWDAKNLSAGFSTADAARIADVPAPAPGEAVDCLFRIASPVRTQIDPAQKTVTFMVTEFGLGERSFDGALADRAAFTRGDNCIVTPTRWSRDRLADNGFDADRIRVVPHGVHVANFAPLSPQARAEARARLGMAEHERLFVNVGVATWNKGLDLLITAFAMVRRRDPRARLLLKDHKGLYGIGVERVIAEVQQAMPGLLDEQVLSGISVLSGSLDQTQLRTLYAVADAYVSPYRAEGFNLPVLEAMACGTPVIVSAGGATDDFCPDGLALRLPSRPGTRDEAPQVQGRFVVPDLDALVDALQQVLDDQVQRDTPQRLAQRALLVQRLSWPAVTQRLLSTLDLALAPPVETGMAAGDESHPAFESSLLAQGART
jgi:glycosyltransferase involved in cell wall biosynthesis